MHEGKDFYIRAFPLSHTKTCVGYTLEELDHPGEFNPEKAESLGIPRGPLWGKLQRGKEVTSADGKIIKPSDVMGEKRSGRKFSFVTDTQYLPSIAREVQGSDLLICEGMFTDDCELDVLLKQAQEVYPKSELKKDRMIFDIPYTD